MPVQFHHKCGENKKPMGAFKKHKICMQIPRDKATLAGDNPKGL
jgi:hypothetical protein